MYKHLEIARTSYLCCLWDCWTIERSYYIATARTPLNLTLKITHFINFLRHLSHFGNLTIALRVISSSEPKAQVSFLIEFCLLFVVENYLYFQNHRANFNHTWHKAHLGDGFEHILLYIYEYIQKVWTQVLTTYVVLTLNINTVMGIQVSSNKGPCFFSKGRE